MYDQSPQEGGSRNFLKSWFGRVAPIPSLGPLAKPTYSDCVFTNSTTHVEDFPDSLFQESLPSVTHLDIDYSANRQNPQRDRLGGF